MAVSDREEFARDLDLKFDVPLAPLTTLGVGGRSRALVRVTDVAGIRRMVAWARAARIPLALLGGGSNTVVTDSGFHGLIVQPCLGPLDPVTGTTPLPDGRVAVTAGAGMDWDALVAWTVEQGLGGIECLSGIPGWVGAAPVQNIGAYGQELAQTLISVEVFDTLNGTTTEMLAAKCGFGYRTSRFKDGPDAGRWIISSVTLGLTPGAEADLRYADLQRKFADAKEKPTLAEVRQAVLTIRRSKGMVFDLADPDSRSCGSFFTNPIVETVRWKLLVNRWRKAGLIAEDEVPPQFGAGEGQIKTSAAWLIERAGFRRGHVHGQAGLSTRHVLAIVNRGQATAEDVLGLAEEIRSTVKERLGIELMREPVLLGGE